MQTEQAKWIFCKKDPKLKVAVNGDKLILVRAHPSDEFQQWIQDYDRVGRLTDDTGRRAFALVNRATGQALARKSRDHLELAPYPRDGSVKISMLWSLGIRLDGTGGFSEVRSLTNMAITLNAQHGNPKEGTAVVLFNSEPYNDHAIWKIEPINTAADPGTSQLRAPPTVSSADE